MRFSNGGGNDPAVLPVLGTGYLPSYELLLVKDAVAGPLGSGMGGLWGGFPPWGSSLVLSRGTDRSDCVPLLVCWYLHLQSLCWLILVARITWQQLRVNAVNEFHSQ